MRYPDTLYGEVEVTEPVLTELMHCSALQRLKGVEQGAYRKPFFACEPPNRFEHSVGVMLLLRRYGVSLEEQVAGLIHDVSHSAFSHGIDYILKRGTEKTQAHQDATQADFVKNSEIPGILAKHGLNVNDILDDARYPLKETEIPDICADRIDYTFRDGVAYKEITVESATDFLEHLTTSKKRWVFDNYTYAKRFAQLFNTLNGDYWAAIGSGVMFQTVGDYISHALHKGYITEDILYSTDQEVLNAIKPYIASDQQARIFHDRMNRIIDFSSSPNNYDAHVFVKSRAIDPLCYHKGTVQRVSDIDVSWGETVKQELKPKEYFIKFEK